jgi:hypothetical protein
LLVAVGFSTAALLWNTPGRPSIEITSESPTIGLSTEFSEVNGAETMWSQTGLFDELIQLGDAEEEQLRLMLESAQHESQYTQ